MLEKASYNLPKVIFWVSSYLRKPSCIVLPKFSSLSIFCGLMISITSWVVLVIASLASDIILDIFLPKTDFDAKDSAPLKNLDSVIAEIGGVIPTSLNCSAASGIYDFANGDAPFSSIAPAVFNPARIGLIVLPISVAIVPTFFNPALLISAPPPSIKEDISSKSPVGSSAIVLFTFSQEPYLSSMPCFTASTVFVSSDSMFLPKSWLNPFSSSPDPNLLKLTNVFLEPSVFPWVNCFCIKSGLNIFNIPLPICSAVLILAVGRFAIALGNTVPKSPLLYLIIGEVKKLPVS